MHGDTNMIHWKDIFTKDGLPWKDEKSFSGYLEITSLEQLHNFLNAVHIRHCLVRPYEETKNYPLVESRELLPSFDSDMWEHAHLPGFAMVAFARPLEYFSEIFQYDIIHPVLSIHNTIEEASCPLEEPIINRNLQTLASRLPKIFHDDFRQACSRLDTSLLDYYSVLMPYLLKLDRAHVIAKDGFGQYHLAGIFASFPSDIDNELKRFGMRIHKFVAGDNKMYERNRIFVYQYLMELYGFPLVSERRTSSAIFARKLQKMGERYLLRVLGQTDRTITTFIGEGNHNRYPRIEKIALIAVDEDQQDALRIIKEGGFFLDAKKRVVIIRITYRQHSFNANNVRQDRALSVISQEILHPLTGEALQGLNIIKDSSNMILRLNDIVRGEYTGRIVYKRTETIENTDTEEKRLKFLYTWLTKHQRRIIGYSDDFFANVDKVVTGYIHDIAKEDAFEQHRDIYREVQERFSYIQQARKIRILEELYERNFKGVRIGYRQMMQECIILLSELTHEAATYFPSLVTTIITVIDSILTDRYLVRTYIEMPEENLSTAGAEIRKNYRRIIALRDNFIAVRKAREAITVQ